jgi:hypothetical protein
MFLDDLVGELLVKLCYSKLGVNIKFVPIRN